LTIAQIKRLTTPFDVEIPKGGLQPAVIRTTSNQIEKIALGALAAMSNSQLKAFSGNQYMSMTDEQKSVIDSRVGKPKDVVQVPS